MCWTDCWPRSLRAWRTVAWTFIDSTGIQSGSASFYYIKTMSRRKDPKGLETRAIRRHVKLTVVIDARSMMMLSMTATPGPDADVNKLVPSVSKAVEHGAGIVNVIGDRGYDSEANRRFVVRELKAEAQMPLRKTDKRAAEPRGWYRRRQRKVLIKLMYRRRPLVESVNRMIKNMSPRALGRSEHARYNELALRAAAHNARRAAVLAYGG